MQVVPIYMLLTKLNCFSTYLAGNIYDDAIFFANAYYGVPLPESILTCADTNVFYNITVSGGGSYVPQQHAHSCTLKLDCDFFSSFNPYLWNIDLSLQLYY